LTVIVENLLIGMLTHIHDQVRHGHPGYGLGSHNRGMASGAGQVGTIATSGADYFKNHSGQPALAHFGG
jgi:hypothetical protein